MEDAIGESRIKLVVGLGNPGRKYEGTRHNVGFQVLDEFLTGTEITFEREKKWVAEVARYNSCLFVKPLTFMNDSGRTVRLITDYFAIQMKEVLVVTDDVTLETGSIRIREKGSHGGQNGVRSIIQHLGGECFPRMKLGVGTCGGSHLTGHVLGRFPPNEQEVVENMLATASQAVQVCIQSGIGAAANQFNSTVKSLK